MAKKRKSKSRIGKVKPVKKTPKVEKTKKASRVKKAKCVQLRPLLSRFIIPSPLIDVKICIQFDTFNIYQIQTITEIIMNKGKKK